MPSLLCIIYILNTIIWPSIYLTHPLPLNKQSTNISLLCLWYQHFQQQQIFTLNKIYILDLLWSWFVILQKKEIILDKLISIIRDLYFNIFDIIIFVLYMIMITRWLQTNIGIIAVDKFKPLLMTKGDEVDDNDYINASFFDVSKDDIPFSRILHIYSTCPNGNISF